jgi:hypothetical protein
VSTPSDPSAIPILPSVLPKKFLNAIVFWTVFMSEGRRVVPGEAILSGAATIERGRTLALPSKPMVVGSVDDPNSKRQFQLEVMVTKLK